MAEATAMDPYAPHRHTLLSPKEVRELSRLRNGPPLHDTSGCWARGFYNKRTGGALLYLSGLASLLPVIRNSLVPGAGSRAHG